MIKAIICLVVLVALANADMYMQHPRGSNNRLNENNGATTNGNRLFNSQNNANGGYCWGPQMYFYTGSFLRVEWTSQHSCGTGSKINNHCQVILQYMTDDGTEGYEVRDGTTTDTIPQDENTYNTLDTTNTMGQTFRYGMHESFYYYDNCTTRDRNKGLFTADQNPGGNARHTRQNPGGNRRGFECSEERDYYPYWHPSPWKDIVIFTDDTSMCDFYKKESQNVKPKNYCSKAKYNQEQECLSNQGEWLSQPSWGLPAPDCLAAPENRDNHLGNGAFVDKNGKPITSSYDWKIPNDPTTAAVLRIRYNISTADFDPWTTFSDKNGEEFFPEDPYVNVAPDDSYGVINMSLAIDTSQFARTFQDRSFTFEIREKPKSVTGRIHNLNVRGKRGNIVQTYPATEYDFVPTNLEVWVGDYVHFQWTGCDTNPQGNDGEGTRGTDRSNIVQLAGPNDNLPIDPKTSKNKLLFKNEEARVRFMWLDQENCLTYEELLAKHGSVNNNFETDTQNCMKLNAAEPYFDGGLVQLSSSGTYHYMSSRNNNFTNRSQKGTIVVSTMLPTWAIVTVAAGSVVFIGAIVLAVMQFRAR